MKKLYGAFLTCLYVVAGLYWLAYKISALETFMRYARPFLWVAVFVLGAVNVWFAFFKARPGENAAALYDFSRFISVCKLLTYIWLAVALFFVVINLVAIVAVGAVLSFWAAVVCLVCPPLWLLLPFVVPMVFAVLTPLLIELVLLWCGAVFVAYLVQLAYSLKTVWRGYKTGVFSLLKALLYAALQFIVIIDIFAMFSANAKIKSFGGLTAIADPSDN